jgi:hypothetical protein
MKKMHSLVQNGALGTIFNVQGEIVVGSRAHNKAQELKTNYKLEMELVV